jgi:hypothetical protein
MRLGWMLGLGAAVTAGVVFAACGSDYPDGFPNPNPDTDGGGVDGNDPVFPDSSSGDAQTILNITPPNPVLTTTGSPVSQQFTALANNTPVSAQWSLDNVSLGVIDANGLFTASGLYGGVSNVTAQSNNGLGSTTVTVQLSLSENPGNIDATTQGKLKAGGNADSAFKWLYPYDKTVLPRGLLAPTLQFAGAVPDAVYVHAVAANITYDGFYKGSNPSQLNMSAQTWKTITNSVGATDPLKVSITKITGGQVTGPITETWTVAQGSLKGTVYYNSYSSPLAGNTGAVLKVQMTKQVTQPTVLLAGCNTCHAVSANGNVLADSTGHNPGDATWDLVNNTKQMATGPDTQFSFSALYPDGSFLLSCATLPGSWPPNIPGMQGNNDSALYNTKTGVKMAAPGFDGKIHKALMPIFSPDGTKVAFNHYDTGGGHTLAVMDFDVKTKTFSNLVDVVNDQAHYVGWPAFLPDSSAILYHADDRQDYATWTGAKANLVLVDLATKKQTPLDALNGMNGSNTYLPYGPAEQNLNYEPTILPEAVGGYFWVLFTSRRDYGNTIVTNSQDDQARKKLWVAAIDLKPTPGKDPSHPAFYLTGQELSAGNMRGFWAFDPCKQNGTSCESGDECCGGFCRQVTESDGAIGRECVPPPTGCAQEFEKCTTASDCCGVSQGYLCINGHCALPPVN